MTWAALIRLTIGMVFAISALAKWQHPSAVGPAVRRLAPLRGSAAALAGAALLAFETACAVALLANLVPTMALYASAGVLLGFCLVVARALRADSDETCGCLGEVVDLRLGWPTLVMNALLAGGAIAAAGQSSFSGSVGETAVLVLLSILLAFGYWLVSYAYTVTRSGERALSLGGRL
jgi:hypothetical protein